MNYSVKLSSITPSATSTLNTLTKELIKEGKSIINLSIGEPDFETPDYIKEAAKKAIDEGITRYTENQGFFQLRKSISDKLKRDNHMAYSPYEIVVSNGAKHSLYNIFQALLNPGDEVIIQSPYWVSYPEMIKLAAGNPVIIKTNTINQFKMKPEQIREVITPKTKIILLNSPSNPTGSVYSKEELMEIGNIAIKHDLYIVSDEIYEKLIFDDKHTSIASLSNELFNRTITVNGVSKAYAMTGWRIGYIATTRDLANTITSFQSHSTSNPSSISQMAAIAALEGPESSVIQMKERYKKRRDLMCELINDIMDTRLCVPKGAFYIFPDISGWLKPLGKQSCVEVAQWLLEECGVAAIPGAAFGSPGYIRFSFATSEENIQRAFASIKEKIEKNNRKRSCRSIDPY
ncbi:pyridoxal phosphate-dependent aminotransferase [Neobacillus vireti]|uniref:Aminotransferase n=1 Tax=Neobacillus vireti LMG 21834 TaxID=1131730 RepID=A0AB94IFI3_9BACI|nr:pyridoxal phosphate-dependent aminotransferase [Neobacillus vireti]ETI65871.1 class I and II aminotransferase [Neobacillus vireti LMG 21834]KLT17496.1 aspartate aminotransferase [Neobacillus vireti]